MGCNAVGSFRSAHRKTLKDPPLSRLVRFLCDSHTKSSIVCVFPSSPSDFSRLVPLVRAAHLVPPAPLPIGPALSPLATMSSTDRKGKRKAEDDGGPAPKRSISTPPWIENRNGLLKPGMNTDVEVHIGRRDSVLAVPNAALRTQRDVTSAGQVLGLSPERLETPPAEAPKRRTARPPPQKLP